MIATQPGMQGGATEIGPVPFHPETSITSANLVFGYIAQSEYCLNNSDLPASNAEAIKTLVDLSSNNNDITIEAPYRAIFYTNGGAYWKSGPVIETNNGQAVYNLPDLSALTAGHIFRLLAADADPGVGTVSFERFGSHTFSPAYTWTDGIIYDGFGSTTRKTVGNPSPLLTQPRIYESISKANYWEAKLNGTSLYSTVTNTVGWSSPCRLFMDYPATGQKMYYKAILLYDGELSSDDATAVRNWLDTMKDPTGGFDPDNYGTTNFHWFAGDGTTMYNAETGGTATVADGEVGRWENRIDANDHVRQATSISRPIRKISVQNGWDAIRFDGSNDFLDGLRADGFIGTGSGLDWTIFIVCKYSSLTAYTCPVAVWDEYLNPTYRSLLANTTGSEFGYNDGVIQHSSSPGAGNTNWHVHAIKMDGDTIWSATSPIKFWLDGVLATGATSYARGIHTITIGGISGYRFNGDIGEIIGYSSLLSDANIEACSLALKSKWGI
jgi:hypothetical protein